MSIRKRLKGGFTLVELMIVVAIVGVLAVLAVYGVRKYIANAKTAEAKNALGQIGKDAASALEREIIAPAVLAGGATAALNRRLCLSASVTVPGTAAEIKGQKYQPNPNPLQDYNVDSATPGMGFACLKFEMSTPQYYMYNYTSDSSATAIGTVITATANGDLNGDDVLSTFILRGAMEGAQLKLAPSIDETNPEE
ncbi:MAG: prepilin-type N-terminal cleavage/methylation domain-containing protein [Labilithrix sp.]|nr:prepilin-type N-terminal cleavage/methylation domain-containing protein [Labilithrix sp.]